MHLGLEEGWVVPLAQIGNKVGGIPGAEGVALAGMGSGDGCVCQQEKQQKGVPEGTLVCYAE